MFNMPKIVEVLQCKNKKLLYVLYCMKLTVIKNENNKGKVVIQ